jgi:tRNA-dihydrouridine synthase A
MNLLPNRFAIAPMMDWTDRHCRFFHRRLTTRAQLFTEMVTAEAIIRGDRTRLLAFSPAESPLALQLGGSDPARLAEAARIGEGFGYDEINLNVGCPSDRVKSGDFGACLMLRPGLVGDCVAAMKAAVRIPVTVKCRLGVDDQDTEAALDDLADMVVAAGVDGIWVHARKAWLKGLSPKENRTVPPLDYERVRRLKHRLPGTFIGLNGGMVDVAAAKAELAYVDGVMLGRAAYERPAILAEVDRLFFGAEGQAPDLFEVARAMIPYAEDIVRSGQPVTRLTRHMLGLFHGRPGARTWRRMLTEAGRSDRGAAIIADALAAVAEAEAAAADRLAA